MFQRLMCAAVAFIAVAFAAGEAEAGKVPIPCTSQKIVKVLELPMTEAFATQTGQHVDLGYLHDGCFSGKWVGYVDSGNRYVTFRPEGLAMALQTLGLTEPPSPPGFLTGLVRSPGQFWVEWLWIVALGCIGVSVVVSERRNRRASAAPQQADAPEAAATSGEPAAMKPEAGASAQPTRSPRVPRAEVPEAALPAVSLRATPAATSDRPARLAASVAPSGQKPVFGRRG